jgi:hypothetical protein
MSLFSYRDEGTRRTYRGFEAVGSANDEYRNIFRSACRRSGDTWLSADGRQERPSIGLLERRPLVERSGIRAPNRSRCLGRRGRLFRSSAHREPEMTSRRSSATRTTNKQTNTNILFMMPRHKQMVIFHERTGSRNCKTSGRI